MDDLAFGRGDLGLEGHELVRDTGWVYARANRIPRMIHELLAAFESVKGRLRLQLPKRSISK